MGLSVSRVRSCLDILRQPVSELDAHRTIQTVLDPVESVQDFAGYNRLLSVHMHQYGEVSEPDKRCVIVDLAIGAPLCSADR